jgi:hypothetical protein
MTVNQRVASSSLAGGASKSRAYSIKTVSPFLISAQVSHAEMIISFFRQIAPSHSESAELLED